MLASMIACQRASAPSTVMRPRQSSFQIVAVFLAESLSAAAGTKRGEPAGLLVRLRMREVRHHRGDDAGPVWTVGASADLVCRREPAALIAGGDRPPGRTGAAECRRVRHPERRHVARRVPEEPAVDTFVRPLLSRLGVGVAGPRDIGRVHAERDVQIGRAVEPDGDLADCEGRDAAWTEDEGLDPGGRAVRRGMPTMCGARPPRSRSAAR